MKTLIINGSPRVNGDTARLIAEYKKKLRGEIVEVSAYYDGISPCVDCRRCRTQKGCAIDDDMAKIYADDYDVAVIASPVHMCGLPGPLVGLAGRFQAYYSARRFLGDEFRIRPKTGVLILVGGGDGSPQAAIKLAKLMLRHMNAELSEENTILSLNTDIRRANG